MHDGGVENYPGTLDDYLWSCQQRDVTPATDAAIKPVAQKRSRQARKEQRRKEAQLRSKQNQGVKPLEKRVGELEQSIARLEKTITEHNEALSEPEVYEDPERRDKLLHEAQKSQRELERAFEEWTESNERLEQLRRELKSMEG